MALEMILKSIHPTKILKHAPIQTQRSRGWVCSFSAVSRKISLHQTLKPTPLAASG